MSYDEGECLRRRTSETSESLFVIKFCTGSRRTGEESKSRELRQGRDGRRKNPIRKSSCKVSIRESVVFSLTVTYGVEGGIKFVLCTHLGTGYVGVCVGDKW